MRSRTEADADRRDQSRSIIGRRAGPRIRSPYTDLRATPLSNPALDAARCRSHPTSRPHTLAPTHRIGGHRPACMTGSGAVAAATRLEAAVTGIRGALTFGLETGAPVKGRSGSVPARTTRLLWMRFSIAVAGDMCAMRRLRFTQSLKASREADAACWRYNRDCLVRCPPCRRRMPDT